MEEELITIETAKLAKDKGFKTNSNEWSFIRDGNMINTNSEGGITGNENTVKIISQSLLQKWFRENHNIHIEVYWDFTAPSNWYYAISEIGNLDMKEICSYPSSPFNTYEQALESALKMALKLIKI